MANGLCLDLGGKDGGLSLWLALKGNRVICSDLKSPEDIASKLHSKYEYSGTISYEAIDATNIPYKEKFDTIVFKSILGGIGSFGKNELKQTVINEIYKALKPGGQLLFAENTEGSLFHKVLRKTFVSWGNRWNYLTYEEIKPLFSEFSQLDFIMTGFLGTFGRTEKQRKILGKIDKLIEPLIPRSKRYIVIGRAVK